MPHVAVSIVAWNSAKYLPEALASLEAQTYQDFSLIVVDNASAEEAAPLVRETFPRAAMLRNTKNLGFSRGHNQAIAYARARLVPEHGEVYVLVMNPDVALQPDFLAEAVLALSRHPEAGSVCGKLLRMTPATDGVSLHGEKTHTIDSAGLRIRKNRRVTDRGSGDQDGTEFDKSTEVFGPSGALALYRLSALEKVAVGDEYFDDDLFAYKEDLDLAWRLRLKGWTSIFTPRAVAYHYRTARGRDKASLFSVARGRRAKSAMVNFLSYRNHLLVLAKNEHFSNLFRHLPLILGYELLKFLYSLVREPFMLFRAIPSYFRLLPRILRKRRSAFTGAVSADAIRAFFG